MKEYVYALDLSLNSTGVCIFTLQGDFVKAITIDTTHEKESRFKLRMIGNTLKKLSDEYRPFIVVIEQGFTLYNSSTQALFKVHGLVSYLFSEYEQIYYPASTIKKIVGGKGNMNKEELYNIIHLRYPNVKLNNFDESDAFAAGITFFTKEGIPENAKKNIQKKNNIGRINRKNKSR